MRDVLLARLELRMRCGSPGVCHALAQITGTPWYVVGVEQERVLWIRRYSLTEGRRDLSGLSDAEAVADLQHRETGFLMAMRTPADAMAPACEWGYAALPAFAFHLTVDSRVKVPQSHVMTEARHLRSGTIAGFDNKGGVPTYRVLLVRSRTGKQRARQVRYWHVCLEDESARVQQIEASERVMEEADECSTDGSEGSTEDERGERPAL